MYIDHSTGGLLVCLPKNNAEGFCHEMKVHVYTNTCNNDRVTQCIVPLVIVTLIPICFMCICDYCVYVRIILCVHRNVMAFGLGLLEMWYQVKTILHVQVIP